MSKIKKTIVQEDIAAIALNIAKEAKKFEGKTILLSGGSGFLGKYIVGVFCYLNDNVFKLPCKVISVDNFITGQSHPQFNYKGRPDILEQTRQLQHLKSLISGSLFYLSY